MSQVDHGALGERERLVLAALADAREELLTFVSAAVQVPSVTGEEGAVAPLFAAWFAEHGFDVETSAVDPALRDRYPALRGEADLSDRPNVFGTLRSGRAGAAAPFVLNGHLDVVPTGPAELWRHDPFSGAREDGRIWGRGSADMKGGLASAMFAARALRDAGVELDRDVQVQCVMAEERGGLGTLSALDTQPLPSAAIVLEPTDCVVAPACGGAVPFVLHVPGEAAHVCVPWTGVSAFEQLMLAYDAIRELEARRNARFSHPFFDGLPSKGPFAAGRIVAGEWHASLPEQATLHGRIGVMPGETVADVRAELQATVAALGERHPTFEQHPATVTWDNEGFAAWETPADDPLVAALDDAMRTVAGASRLGAMTYGCDAGHFAARDVPIALFGPGRIENAHLPDEHVEEDQLLLAAEVLALTLLRYAG